MFEKQNVSPREMLEDAIASLIQYAREILVETSPPFHPQFPLFAHQPCNQRLSPRRMEPEALQSPLQDRPYRSHKVPACKTCRRRKIRCHVDISGQPCRFCRERDLGCEIGQTKHNLTSNGSAERPTKRARTASAARPASDVSNVPDAGKNAREQFTSPAECSSVMMNPTMAEDVRVLESYFTSSDSGDRSFMKPYSRVLHTSGESILYSKVPRPRTKPEKAMTTGRVQRDIMEQVLGSLKEDVINLYF